MTEAKNKGAQEEKREKRRKRVEEKVKDNRLVRSQRNTLSSETSLLVQSQLMSLAEISFYPKASEVEGHLAEISTHHGWLKQRSRFMRQQTCSRMPQAKDAVEFTLLVTDISLQVGLTLRAQDDLVHSLNPVTFTKHPSVTIIGLSTQAER